MNADFAVFVWAGVASLVALIAILGWIDSAEETRAAGRIAEMWSRWHGNELKRGDTLRQQIEMLKRALRSRQQAKRNRRGEPSPAASPTGKGGDKS